jgi:type I restriction enzyme S subunit
MEIEHTAPQVAQKNINLAILRSLEIPVPPHSLQRNFAARVADMRSIGSKQSKSRRRLDDLFQSLLHRAFIGEV